MLSGPFEWKQGLLGRRVLVEYSTESMLVTKGSVQTEIRFSEIDGAYFYFSPQVLLMRSIFLQIVSNSNQEITITGSRIAFVMGEQFEDAQEAIAAFFLNYGHAKPGAEVVLGFRRSMRQGMLWAVLTIGTLGYAFFSMRRDGMMSTQLEYIAFGALSLFMMLWMALGFRRSTGSRRKSALELFEQLKEA